MRYLETMGLRVLTSRAVFTPDEIVQLKSQFKQADVDHDGVITQQELRLLIANLDVKVSQDSLAALFKDVKQ